MRNEIVNNKLFRDLDYNMGGDIRIDLIGDFQHELYHELFNTLIFDLKNGTFEPLDIDTLGIINFEI